MKTAIAILISVVMNAWVPTTHDIANEAKQWKEYTTLQNKQYDGPDVTFYRIQAFMANHKTMAEVNSNMIKEGRDFRLGVNQFADLHYEEFIQMRGGIKTDETREKNYVVLEEYETVSSIDWRNSSSGPVVNAVQNQQQCGSCWAFSTIASIESRYALSSGALLKFSEQQLVDCNTGENQGCSGGWMDVAFTYLESNGAMLESDYGYTATDGQCKYDASKAIATPTGFVDVEHTDSALAAAVAQGPVSVTVAANRQWQMYSSGVATLADCPNAQLDHGVAVVGFTPDAWIVRNSWGPTWGEEGYIRLSRTGNVCGVQNTPSYPTF